MGKISLNFTDPFNASPRTLNVDEKTSIKDLTRLLSEELGYVPSENRYVGGFFKNIPLMPVIYDPKVGILSNELSLGDFKTIKNNATLAYYVFPPTALTVNDIFLENNTRFGEFAQIAIVEWAGAYYPVVLPLQSEQENVFLVKYVFAQLKTIMGLQSLPQGWQNLSRWQFHNVRSGEHIDGTMLGNFSEKIRHGDLLRLLPKTRDEHDEIIIINETRGQPADDLDIKIGDELLDSITIEQSEPVKVNECLIELIQGDITLQEVDAIVNAAKPTLAGGSGVDGAIHEAAGPLLAKASAILAPCSPGRSVITPGFHLPAKWVIHTVGPIYQDGKHDEEKTLANAYRSSLAIAFFSGFSSIAFPAISTGVYGYPAEQAAEITWKTIRDTLLENKDKTIMKLRVIVFDAQFYETYAEALKRLV